MNEEKKSAIFHMEEIIISIVTGISGIVKIAPEDNLIEDVGFDSINMLELIGKIEEQFNISIKDEDFDIENFATIKSIVVLVKKYNGQN
jgi:acyl carrier protein